MAEYRLSARAEAQLLDIYDFSVATFGAYQAEAYHAGLERTFDLLANFPRIGQLVEELAPPVSPFSLPVAHIFYTEEAAYVLIRAIYHRSQDVGPQLFD